MLLFHVCLCVYLLCRYWICLDDSSVCWELLLLSSSSRATNSNNAFLTWYDVCFTMIVKDALINWYWPIGIENVLIVVTLNVDLKG